MDAITSELGLVAPFAGAWIEIFVDVSMPGTLKSHPSRVRGLKSTVAEAIVGFDESHPSRVRGLK